MYRYHNTFQAVIVFWH